MTYPKRLFPLFLILFLLVSVACQAGELPESDDPALPSDDVGDVESVEVNEVPVTMIPTDEPTFTPSTAAETTKPNAEPTQEPRPTSTPVPEPPAPTTVEVRFFEGAPKDRFQIENIGSCALGESIINLDLTQSVGKLVFDTTASGVGVEVFQPFEVVEGEIELVDGETVVDGEALLSIRVDGLPPGASVGFTIDVDDTLEDSELGMIQVTDSEIEGGIVTISNSGLASTSGQFEANRASLQVICS